MFHKIKKFSYLIGIGLVLFSGVSKSATLQMIQSNNEGTAFDLQLSLENGDSLGSFSIDLGLGSLSNSAALGFPSGPGFSIGSALDYNGAQGGVLLDGTTLRVFGDTLSPGAGAVSLPSGLMILDLFRFDIKRPFGSTATVNFTLLDWELYKIDFNTILPISNKVGDVLAVSKVPLPGSLLLFLSPILGFIGSKHSKLLAIKQA
jgi:hypothetical protein